MSKIQNEAAEAICSALFQLHFVPIGEREDVGGDGLVSWFMRGEFPRRIRVSVRRSRLADAVVVKVEWHNVAVNGSPLKCEQTFTVSTLHATRLTLNAPIQETVLAVLHIFQDVLAGEGVAGVISELAPASPEDVESET